jgi:hypothetical protein
VAAEGEFPRGWILNNQVGPGSTASVTVPASPGVVHILDAIFARMQNTTGGVEQTVNIQVTTLATVLQVELIMAATIGSDDVALSGLNIASASGGILTVNFSAVTVAGYMQSITAQGHDI